jgi:hypothetical protein
MKGRTPPPPPDLAPEEAERRRVLVELDLPAARAWGLLGDDEQALRSMHQARVDDPVMPRVAKQASRRWLKEHAPQVAGPRYGKRQGGMSGGS